MRQKKISKTLHMYLVNAIKVQNSNFKNLFLISTFVRIEHSKYIYEI